MYRKSFEKLVRYDQSVIGITLPLVLRYGDQSTEVLDAKIDTGSPYCIFCRVAGELLGITIEGGELDKVKLANGTLIPIYGHSVVMSVNEVEVESIVYFWQDELLTRNVLGRAGWINKFRLCIVDHDLELYFSEYNDPGE